MDRGFFVSGVAGDMTAQKLNTIAHNLANVNTAGYMLDRTAFSTMLANVSDANKDPTKLPAAYMTMDHQYINGDKGIIRKTGNDLDFAIRGDAFFKIMSVDNQGVEKPAYSRAGNFHLDGEGILVNEAGLKVLDDSSNPITIPRGVVSVAEDGSIRVKTGNETVEVARIGTYEIKSMQAVHKLSGTLLETDDTNVQEAGEGISVHQGMLEGSNVNAVLMMVAMMQNTRSNQSMMKIMEQYNQQEGQITQTVGRVPG